ncbi:MAG: hypothetical protein RL757_2871 [Bacteroidota bacterium]|jgi:pantoate--beta-alanine ligase
MLIFKKIVDLQRHLGRNRALGREIDFAPTMGALHEGHVSLVRAAKNRMGISVVSIFVNPTQFNDPKDLEKYPRTLDQDIEMLHEAGCDVLFLPSTEEIYPNGVAEKAKLNFGKLDKVLEGTFRPGHFDGMAQVVHRLLQIVRPHRLYMGQKDFQQWTIVQSMLKQLNLTTELVMMPIVREKDGLAMSSRNVRLSPEARSVAPIINETLQKALDMVDDHSPAEIQQHCLQLLDGRGFKIEYVEIADGNTLLPIRLFEDTDFAVALVAIWLGDVRLIDNIILKQYIPNEELEH